MLWVRRALVERHRFPFAGWLRVEHPERMENRRLELRHTAQAAEVGTFAFDVPLRLGAALRLLESVGFDAIHRRIVELTDRLRAGLASLGITPLTPDDPAIRSGITSFPVADPEDFVAALAERQVIASPRRGAVRVALHACNDEADVDAALEAIRQVARAAD